MMTEVDPEVRRRLERWLASKGEAVEAGDEGLALAAYRRVKARIRKRGELLSPDEAECEIADEIRRMRDERKQPESSLAEGF